MNDFFKDNPLATISTLLLYFGACAGLWHIGYWSKFDINYLQYMEISDIIKDFAQPFFISAFTALVGLLAGPISGILTDKILPKNEESESGSSVNLSKYLLAIYVLMYITFFLCSDKYTRIGSIPFVSGLAISVYLLRIGFLRKQIPQYAIRFYIVSFMVLLPLYSYFNSRLESLLTYDNAKYKYISEINYDGDANYYVKNLKLIGTSRSNLFLTDYCNKQITILNLENVNAIRYKTEEKDYKQVSWSNLFDTFR